MTVNPAAAPVAGWKVGPAAPTSATPQPALHVAEDPVPHLLPIRLATRSTAQGWHSCRCLFPFPAQRGQRRTLGRARRVRMASMPRRSP
eukprot:CAMPEP_0198702610 /NCGR_PEP_ID=MMETSP1468-20131203/388856_1 /TAXON_ID=1461545 /ORGANISM="Mantoniella sp, Strain CCMP1436" /LENGTH=88 /DNA_ID=CAMNT_0044461161 /DNA_START=356 /DNA_END=623 /DNA_ORIENTATION=-